MPTSPFLIRFALVAIFAVFALGFFLPSSQAQPGRPPGGFGAPPPGFGGRPPGGITGMPGPGGVTGRPPGGIAGTPGGIHGGGIHGVHGAGVSGMGGTGFSGTPGAGIGGPPRTEIVWRCSKCNFELGRGPNDPGQASCPACGVRFDGGTIGPGRFGAVPSTPPTTTPAPSDPGTGGSAPTINPFAGGTTPVAAPEVFAAPADGGDSSSSDDSSGSSGRSRTIKLIGIVCGSILLLGALAALGVVVANASAAKPARHRPARRRIFDDE